MPQIVFIDNNIAALTYETIRTEILVQQIQMGLWKPPLQVQRGPFRTIRLDETLVVYTITETEPLLRRMNFAPMEVRIIQGMAAGMSDDQLAISCGIKPRTVRFYVSKLKARLNANTREHLIAKVGVLGLFDETIVG